MEKGKMNVETCFVNKTDAYEEGCRKGYNEGLKKGNESAGQNGFAGFMIGLMAGLIVGVLGSNFITKNYSEYNLMPKQCEFVDLNGDGINEQLCSYSDKDKRIMYQYEGKFYSREGLKELITKRYNPEIKTIENKLNAEKNKKEAELEKTLKQFDKLEKIANEEKGK